ncbi:S-phase kinase-associated protein 1 [Chionoecetes opilio]|uniref:S-phase kinase-associated protein 1 n=1 Tax=Chionoecetes opilio TaxID=41210 RepID=A0A8J4XTC7_CHIOP|nr:S-phase kinase-associated protein 1 [Chionoecetes opilio]
MPRLTLPCFSDAEYQAAEHDGDTFEVDVEIAKQSVTIKTMLEDLVPSGGVRVLGFVAILPLTIHPWPNPSCSWFPSLRMRSTRIVTFWHRHEYVTPPPGAGCQRSERTHIAEAIWPTPVLVPSLMLRPLWHSPMLTPCLRKTGPHRPSTHQGSTSATAAATPGLPIPTLSTRPPPPPSAPLTMLRTLAVNLRLPLQRPPGTTRLLSTPRMDEDEEEVVPLPNVNAAILKVIQWCTYHKDDHLSLMYDNKEKRTDTSPPGI